jgi:hypothetical protein
MASVRSIPRNVYPAGTYDLPNVIIQNSVTVVGIVVNRFNWPDTGGEVISASLEVSVDGGSTWSPLFSFATKGGVFDYKGKGDVSSVKIEIPAGTQRRLRGSVTLAVSLDLSASMEAA